MGFPPPPDAHSPTTSNPIDADVGFAPSPAGASLCGFKFPPFGFSYHLSLKIPKFPPFSFPPSFSWFLGINCNFTKPISASVGFGGGRIGNVVPQPFDSDT